MCDSSNPSPVFGFHSSLGTYFTPAVPLDIQHAHSQSPPHARTVSQPAAAAALLDGQLLNPVRNAVGLRRCLVGQRHLDPVRPVKEG